MTTAHHESTPPDLMVVGTGALGTRLARLWRREHPAARITCVTRTVDRHERLIAEGFAVATAAQLVPASNILFAVPPSSDDEYRSLVAGALSRWYGSTRGCFVLVSSTGVYRESDGGTCCEDSPVHDQGRTKAWIAAEDDTRSRGGCVLRCAGLYASTRGPHQVYLRSTQIARRPDGWINLIHYDDAARLCLAILQSDSHGATYLGVDLEPVTRASMWEALARYHPEFPVQPTDPSFFTVSDGPLGKRCDGQLTRAALGWQPRHPTFYQWLASEYPVTDWARRPLDI